MTRLHTAPPAAYSDVRIVAPHRLSTPLRLVATLLVVALAGIITVAVVRYRQDDSRRDYLADTGWPTRGQAAYQLGSGPLESGPGQRPAPIASLAKVMTAYLVLRHYPGARGLTITVSRADVLDTAHRAAEDQSLVPVRAGEHLTGRQALAALLLPSANNVAVMLARAASGSITSFVAEMNRVARSLQMSHTVYTDPSGFRASTRSTATDQLLLARAAMHLPLLRALVSRSSAQIPVAGTIHNTDTLLGDDGFAGIKTGSMDASGGCFMFLSHRAGGDLYGVVLGQHGHNLISAGLYAAKQLADHVSPGVG